LQGEFALTSWSRRIVEEGIGTIYQIHLKNQIVLPELALTLPWEDDTIQKKKCEHLKMSLCKLKLESPPIKLQAGGKASQIQKKKSISVTWGCTSDFALWKGSCALTHWRKYLNVQQFRNNEHQVSEHVELQIRNSFRNLIEMLLFCPPNATEKN
jgi:hypothetical protein